MVCRRHTKILTLAVILAARHLQRVVVHAEEHGGATAPMRVRLTDELLSRFIVVPEHKLLFCYIEKVGCTAFNQLFLNVRRQSRKPAETDAHMLWFQNTPAKHQMSKADLEAAIVDPSWHKAVFYRDPLERFISGYVSKCVPGHDRDMIHCALAFGSKNASIETAVRKITGSDATKGVGQRTDVHFMHQHRFCGGLIDTLRYYDTVERLEQHSSRGKVSKLLRKVGINPASVLGFDRLFPSPSVKHTYAAGPEGMKHNTNAGAKLLSYLYTSEIAGNLTRHYAGDYLLFGFPAPTWAIKAYEGPEPSYTGPATRRDISESE